MAYHNQSVVRNDLAGALILNIESASGAA